MASYPSGIVSTAVFTTKANTLDIIDASHPNLIQEEVIAIETALGTNPAQSTNGSGSYVSAATAFGTVNARLNNHEIGILGDVHTQYVKKVDGVVTTASTSSGVVRNIYSSTSNPTGGMDGDVWLKYV